MDPSARIKSHMTDDHQLALADYLVTYGGVKASTFDEKSIEMTAVDEVSFEVTYNSSINYDSHKTFKWTECPEDENITVKSMKDIKDKLIAMAKYAAGKQGYSHVRVTDYPKFNTDSAFMVSILVILVLGTYDLNYLKALFKNDPITSNLAPYFPQAVWNFLDFAGKNMFYILVTTYVIHIGEIIFVMIPNLIKYRVPFRQSVVWCLLHFVEGFFSISKFNKKK